jgi:hypothetical protein
MTKYQLGGRQWLVYYNIRSRMTNVHANQYTEINIFREKIVFYTCVEVLYCTGGIVEHSIEGKII